MCSLQRYQLLLGQSLLLVTHLYTHVETSGERHTAVGKVKVNEVLTYRGVRLSYIFCGKVYFCFSAMLKDFFYPGTQSWND